MPGPGNRPWGCGVVSRPSARAGSASGLLSLRGFLGHSGVGSASGSPSRPPLPVPSPADGFSSKGRGKGNVAPAVMAPCAVAIELTRKRTVRARPLPQAGGFLTLALACRFSSLGVREALKWERGPCRRRRTSSVTDASRLAAAHPCAMPTSPSSVTNAQENRLPPGAGPQGGDEGPVPGGPKGKEPPKQASIRVMKG